MLPAPKRVAKDLAPHAERVTCRGHSSGRSGHGRPDIGCFVDDEIGTYLFDQCAHVLEGTKSESIDEHPRSELRRFRLHELRPLGYSALKPPLDGFADLPGVEAPSFEAR